MSSNLFKETLLRVGSDNVKSMYHKAKDDSGRKAIAVACALELVKHSSQNSGCLKENICNLNMIVEAIEAELKPAETKKYQKVSRKGCT